MMALSSACIRSGSISAPDLRNLAAVRRKYDRRWPALVPVTIGKIRIGILIDLHGKVLGIQ